MTAVTRADDRRLICKPLHGNLSPEARAFATNLRAERLRLGIAHDVLGGRAGLKRDAVRRYESGERVPSIDRAAKLARALGVALDALVGAGE